MSGARDGIVVCRYCMSEIVVQAVLPQQLVAASVPAPAGPAPAAAMPRGGDRSRWRRFVPLLMAPAIGALIPVVVATAIRPLSMHWAPTIGLWLALLGVVACRRRVIPGGLLGALGLFLGLRTFVLPLPGRVGPFSETGIYYLVAAGISLLLALVVLLTVNAARVRAELAPRWTAIAILLLSVPVGLYVASRYAGPSVAELFDERRVQFDALHTAVQRVYSAVALSPSAGAPSHDPPQRLKLRPLPSYREAEMTNWPDEAITNTLVVPLSELAGEPRSECLDVKLEFRSRLGVYLAWSVGGDPPSNDIWHGLADGKLQRAVRGVLSSRYFVVYRCATDVELWLFARRGAREVALLHHGHVSCARLGCKRRVLSYLAALTGGTFEAAD